VQTGAKDARHHRLVSMVAHVENRNDSVGHGWSGRCRQEWGPGWLRCGVCRHSSRKPKDDARALVSSAQFAGGHGDTAPGCRPSPGSPTKKDGIAVPSSDVRRSLLLLLLLLLRRALLAAGFTRTIGPSGSGGSGLRSRTTRAAGATARRLLRCSMFAGVRSTTAGLRPQASAPVRHPSSALPELPQVLQRPPRRLPQPEPGQAPHQPSR
jgi:hypothetical protein